MLTPSGVASGVLSMSNGADRRKGSCQCGRVTYEVPREPKAVAKCHCQMCQKSTGSGTMTAVGFAADDVKLAGETRTYTYTADSGNPVTMTFCPNCASTLFMTTPRLAGLVLVRAGTLDDSTGVLPQFELFMKRRPSWDHETPGIPQFPEMPPG